MLTRFPCGICLKPVAKNHKAVKCDYCDFWVHMKCNKINTQIYNLLLNDNSAWYCLACSKKFIPFSTLNVNEFHSTIQGKKIKLKTLSRKRSTLESILVDKHNDARNESNLENSWQYFLKDDFNKTLNAVDYKSTNFFHMNISSLTYNFDQLHTILSEIYINFDLIGIAESRLKNDIIRTTNIDIKNYTFEHTPTEISCGGSLLYIKYTLKYICRKDLQIYKAAELESTFIELYALPPEKIQLWVVSIDIQVCIHLNLTVII